MKRINKKGFTLVELLAVIVILGIILLIAVPGINIILQTAKERSYASSVKMAIENVEKMAMLAENSNTCYVKFDKIKDNLDSGTIDGDGVVVYNFTERKGYVSAFNSALKKKIVGKGLDLKDSDLLDISSTDTVAGVLGKGGTCSDEAYTTEVTCTGASKTWTPSYTVNGYLTSTECSWYK